MGFFNQLYLYKLSHPPPQLNWCRLCMYSSFQINDLAALCGVSAWTQNDKFLKFLFLMQRQKYQRHWNCGRPLNPLCLVTSSLPPPFQFWFWRYIFILKVVPTYTLKICLLTCSGFDHLSSYSSIKTLFWLLIRVLLFSDPPHLIKISKL